MQWAFFTDYTFIYWRNWTDSGMAAFVDEMLKTFHPFLPSNIQLKNYFILNSFVIFYVPKLLQDSRCPYTLNLTSICPTIFLQKGYRHSYMKTFNLFVGHNRRWGGYVQVKSHPCTCACWWRFFNLYEASKGHYDLILRVNQWGSNTEHLSVLYFLNNTIDNTLS